MSCGRWLLLTVAALGLACGAPAPGDTFELRGRIGYDGQLEGGWWYLQSESGSTVTPTEPLPEAFQVPGMPVRATLILVKEVAGFLPGPFVQVVALEPLPVTLERPSSTLGKGEGP